MDKILYLFVFIFVLTGCFWSKTEEKKEEIPTPKPETTEVKKENPIVQAYEGINVDTSADKLAATRGAIELDDLDLLAAGEKTTKADLDSNSLLQVSEKFKENIAKKSLGKVSQKVMGGILYADYEEEIKKVSPKVLMDLSLQLDVEDANTGLPIRNGLVYVNNIMMAEVENGKVHKDFTWPMGTEKFHILVRTGDYGDGFLVLNSINSEGGLLTGTIKLNKAFVINNVDLAKENKIETPKLQAEFEKCSLVDSKGVCSEDTVDVKVNFITGNQANTNAASVNMRAITKEGELVNLVSGGMGFIDFTTQNGEYLQLGEGKTMTVTYNVTDEDINIMDTKEGINDKEGYWWYDKDAGIWRETGVTGKFDAVNKTWTVEVDKLY